MINYACCEIDVVSSDKILMFKEAVNEKLRELYESNFIVYDIKYSYSEGWYTAMIVYTKFGV